MTLEMDATSPVCLSRTAPSFHNSLASVARCVVVVEDNLGSNPVRTDINNKQQRRARKRSSNSWNICDMGDASNPCKFARKIVKEVN